jgi:putative mRNA 3-end processing factor
VFFFEDGLRLLELDLAVDARQRQPRGFISHAHFDHLAPHELAFCTPATARLYRSRLGGDRLVHELPFRDPFDWNGHRLTTFPAGHILGSAMLLVESPQLKLLYTGDFRLRPSTTAEAADPPRADYLVIEATFGLPKYRMPPRQQAIDDLTGILHTAIHAGRRPVIFAYVLGKAQEITRVLVDAGFHVRQHPAIYQLSREYELAACPLGQPHYSEFGADGAEMVAAPRVAPLDALDANASTNSVPPSQRPEVLVFPPPGHRWGGPALPADSVTIAVTGWAIDPQYRFKAGVDYAVPFSDHADFDELLECIDRVAPRQVYCWHGQCRFVDELRERGWDAHWLPSVRRPRPFTRTRQQRLF